MPTEWNKFQSQYAKTHKGVTKEQLAKAYHAHKNTSKKTQKSPVRGAGAAAHKASPVRHRSASPKRIIHRQAKRSVKRIRSASPKRAQKSLNLNKVLAGTPKTRNLKRTQLKAVMKRQSEGRGSRTRGVAAGAPQHGVERHELKAKCGARAFLDAKEEKYPIVAALNRGGKNCQVSCPILTAAKSRGCQQNRPNIAKKAQALGVKHCGWDNKKASPCKQK